MAFVARRTTEGKLVDCQVISGGLRSNALSVSDVSDDDTDSGTVNGYSNRSYVSPTVRYVATKDEEDDLGSCYTFDGTHGRETEPDLEQVVNYSEPYESGEEQNIQESPDDYLSEEETDKSEQDMEESAVKMPRHFTPDRQLNDNSSVDDMSLASIDEATIYSPANALKMRPDDDLSIASYDVATICHPGAGAQLQQDDGLSMSSFDVATICQPDAETNLQLDDTISLGSVNSATVCRPVKPGAALDTISKNSLDCQSQITSRTYNVNSTAVRRDDCSSASTCSWTDMYGGALKQSESRSNIVPSLSLNLSTNSSSGSSTYFRTFDDKKERHGQAAYQEWVKRKERQKIEKQQAAKEERDKKDAETAMRQRLAKERYQEWCRQKELQQKKQSTNSIKSASSSTSYSSNSSSNSFGSNSPNRTQQRLIRKEISQTTQKNVQDWDRIKKQQQQRDRERIRQQQLSKARLEEQRKQKSEGAWQNWMKSVGKRAKPVPLNQGFDTLRGTISNIYVNPNQWVSNIDPHDTRGN